MSKQQKYLLVGAALCVAGYFVAAAVRKRNEAEEAKTVSGKIKQEIPDMLIYGPAYPTVKALEWLGIF